MRSKQLWLGVTVMAVCLLSDRTALAVDTFYIEESTDFTGNGCESVDTNTITARLQTALQNAGWSGSRYTNANAWPQDFIEACSSAYWGGTGSGLDSTWADTATLTVYAGAGNKGTLGWGFKKNGRCAVDFSSSMRLGSMAGARSGYAIYATSCTLNTSSLVSEANFQWMNQQFGFHDAPAIGDNHLKAFWDEIDPVSNKNAWLNVLEDEPGLFTGDNSPIVVSYGSTSTNCTNEHNNKMFKRAINTNRSGGASCGNGQPAFYYCYSLRNNGGCPF